MVNFLNSISALTWLVLLPLLGSFLIVLTPASRIREIRRIATITASLTLMLSLMFLVAYNPLKNGVQFAAKFNWVPSLGISYHVGLDGISVVMILLHSILSFSGILVSYSIRKRVKLYFTFYMILIASIFGVFTSLDLFFLYLFYE